MQNSEFVFIQRGITGRGDAQQWVRYSRARHRADESASDANRSTPLLAPLPNFAKKCYSEAFLLRANTGQPQTQWHGGLNAGHVTLTHSDS